MRDLSSNSSQPRGLAIGRSAFSATTFRQSGGADPKLRSFVTAGGGLQREALQDLDQMLRAGRSGETVTLKTGIIFDPSSPRAQRFLRAFHSQWTEGRPVAAVLREFAALRNADLADTAAKRLKKSRGIRAAKAARPIPRD